MIDLVCKCRLWQEAQIREAIIAATHSGPREEVQHPARMRVHMFTASRQADNATTAVAPVAVAAPPCIHPQLPSLPSLPHRPCPLPIFVFFFFVVVIRCSPHLRMHPPQAADCICRR